MQGQPISPSPLRGIPIIYVCLFPNIYISHLIKHCLLLSIATCTCPLYVKPTLLLMLLSHCGEYMANGLTNAVRHEFVMIANDRHTFVSVRKHSRSFLWCFECYAGLTSGESMENGLTNAIRHQFAMIAK